MKSSSTYKHTHFSIWILSFDQSLLAPKSSVICIKDNTDNPEIDLKVQDMGEITSIL